MAASYTQIYTCADTNNRKSISQDSSHDEQIGIAIKSGSPLIGEIPAKVIVKLKRTGSPTGPIRIRIRNGLGNDGTILYTFTDTKDASSISTASGGTNYTFTDPTNTVALQSGYQLAVEYTDASSNSSNKIEIYHADTDTISNVNLVTMGTGNSNPDDETTLEFAGTIYKVSA